MPKKKTHSGAKKRFRVTGTGKIMREQANRRHLLEHKSSQAHPPPGRRRRGGPGGRQDASRSCSASDRLRAIVPGRCGEPPTVPQHQGELTWHASSGRSTPRRSAATILERASGYRGQRSRLYRKAKEQVTHSLVYAYRRPSRTARATSASCGSSGSTPRPAPNGMTYNRFIQGLKAAGVEVDRKILAELAVNDAGRVRRAGRGWPRPPCRPTSTPRGLTVEPARPTQRPSARSRRLAEPRAADLPRHAGGGGPAARQAGVPRPADGRFLAEGPQAVREAGSRPRPGRRGRAVRHRRRRRAPPRPARRRARPRAAGARASATRRWRRSPRPSPRRGSSAVCAFARRPARRGLLRRRARRGWSPCCAARPRPGQRRHRDPRGRRGRRRRRGARRRQRRPVQRQVRAGQRPAACSTCRWSPASAVAEARARRCGPPGCGCSPPTARRRDLDDVDDAGAARRPDRLALRQRGVGAAAEDAGAAPTPWCGCRSTGAPRASTWPRAAAVCLYASARAQRRPGGCRTP